MITIIVAYDEDHVMGNKGEIPWKISEDFKHFKRMTLGNPCIMGRKTWDSLSENYKPLPNRPNIIVSKNSVALENEWRGKSRTAPTFFEHTLEEAIDFASAAYPDKEIFIIGGAQIYKQAMEKQLVDRVLVSHIKGFHEGDTFFPVDNMGFVKSYRTIQEFDDFTVVEYTLCCMR